MKGGDKVEYIYLEEGEIIQYGDDFEYSPKGCERWGLCVGYIGQRVRDVASRHVRRPITNKNQSKQFNKGDNMLTKE